MIDDGLIGELREVHFYNGNRGPLWHGADKQEVTAQEVEHLKPDAWWYKKASGGGALLDYLGYGATLGTWYMNGKSPIEVTCTVDEAPEIEVDQHAIAVLRYNNGLSRMETRWGTFTDPWKYQPQPTCGFTFIGRLCNTFKRADPGLPRNTSSRGRCTAFRRKKWHRIHAELPCPR